MEHVIYYFTGTGNSLAIAKGIKAQLENTDIIEIRSNGEPVTITAKTLGLIFPVYCWGAPNLVVDFLNKANISKETYIYSVACYGGMLAKTNVQISNILKAKELVLSAGFSIKMPGNFIPMYDIADEVKQDKLFETKDAKIRMIADIVGKRKSCKLETSMGLLGTYLSSTVYKKSMVQMKYFDSTFTVDASCNGCGICAKICPKENITLVDNSPKWHNNCEACLACIHWCPQKAIQSGDKTSSRRRYHNPLITVKEMLKR